MITYMQFAENGLALSVSSATEDNDVNFMIENLEDSDAYSFDLKYPELVQLRDWLTKQINILREDYESEAP